MSVQDNGNGDKSFTGYKNYKNLKRPASAIPVAGYKTISAFVLLTDDSNSNNSITTPAYRAFCFTYGCGMEFIGPPLTGKGIKKERLFYTGR